MALHSTAFAGLAVFLAVTSMYGCVHGFIARDPHRWRWLVVFLGFTAVTGAGAGYVLSRRDVHLPSALAIGAVLGALLFYVARRRS
jgi:hypothetical protein